MGDGCKDSRESGVVKAGSRCYVLGAALCFMMTNLTLPVIFAATLDSGLRRNDGMGFACLRATHRQAGMTVDRSLTSGARADATNGLRVLVFNVGRKTQRYERSND